MPDHRAAQLSRTILLCLLAVPVSGCAERDLFLSGGSTVAGAAMQERGLSGALDDTSLRLAISNAWFQYSVDLFREASLMISRGDVVMIGRAPDDLARFEAELLARQAGARKLANEITVGPPLSWQTELRDSAISTQLSAELTFDRDVASLNYDVETRDGVVYLTGEARSEEELRRVTYLASHLDGVRVVKSFVHVPSPLVASATNY